KLIAERHELLCPFGELIRLLHIASRLAWKVDTGDNAEAEVANIFVEARSRKPGSDLRKSDVARFFKCLSEGDHTGWMIVADRVPAELVAATFSIDRITGRNRFLFECCGCGDKFHRRAWLVHISDRAHTDCRLFSILDVVRIEAWIAGNR